MSNWSIKESKACVVPKIPKSQALEYVSPDIKKVAVIISSDEPEFIPAYSSDKNTADLLANIPDQRLVLSKDSSAVVDCGFSVEIPIGYKICVSSSLSGVFLNLIDDKKLKVNIMNFGQKLILQHKQKIGKIWIEPVYFFDWIQKG